MSEWSVAITVSSPGDGRDLDGDVARISAELDGLAPTVSVGSEAATVRVALDGNMVRDALARALVEVRAALDEVGWPHEVRHVEAVEWSEFERRLDNPTYPELVGITEIAQLLGTSRQRASELARSSRFPSPLAELAAGPVWLKPTVTRFAEDWDRRPGRPRSKTA